METPKKSTWLERIEEIAHALEGSTVGELEIVEGDTEIVIRRAPGMVVSAVAALPAGLVQIPGASTSTRHADTSVPIAAPLTGVFYSSPSPTTSAFVNVGDVIQIGQVVALVEAMKVFNEIAAEAAGRVVSIVPKNGDVVQKGDALLRIEPF
jgi:acetyl-CoA carboxylase biotin carboxyl carrier protein